MCCLARPANGNRSRSFRLIVWPNLKCRLCRLRALSLQSETQTMSIETATVGYNGSQNSWLTHLHGPSAFERGGSISTGMSCRRSLRLSWVRVWGFADSDLSCNVGGRGFGIGVLASKQEDFDSPKARNYDPGVQDDHNRTLISWVGITKVF